MKLIIWDLDGVLWTGSISEGGIQEVDHRVISFIIESEKKGVVHAVCSNNSHTAAKKMLEKLGIWNLFIFPSIEFGAKGPRVQSIIQSCNLRSCDVLFVDDNSVNLNEVKFYIPDINVESDTSFIEHFTMPAGKSRTSFYRILEAKQVDKGNDSFLYDSNINVALVENNDCLLFSKRISEMVNRANVLNFSRTRFTEEEAVEQLSAPAMKTNYAIFAWDKYGYYGLIGFFSIENINNVWQLNHFVFSCRTLTMGIENFFAKYIQETMNYPANWKYNPVDISGDYDYIKLHKFKDVENYIREQEGIELTPPTYSAKIYAWCHSPVYWILTEQTHKIDYEHVFDQHNVNSRMNTENYYYGNIDFDDAPNNIIIAAYNEFKFTNWWNDNSSVTIEHMTTCVNKFVDDVKASGRNLLVLLPDLDGLEVDHRLSILKELWISKIDTQLEVITIPRETEDFRVWSRITMYDTAKKIVEWVDKMDKFG